MGYGGYNERVSNSVLKGKDEFIRPWFIIRWAWKWSGKCYFKAERCYIISTKSYVQSLYINANMAVKMKGLTSCINH